MGPYGPGTSCGSNGGRKSPTAVQKSTLGPAVCQPQVLAPLTQHSKVFSSALGDPTFICQSSSAFLEGSVRAWDWWVLFFPRADSAFPVLAGLGSLCGGHGTASACWAVLPALGCFLAWGKLPGSVMSLVVLSVLARLLAGLRHVPGLGGVYVFGACQQVLRM